jgi:precorrin-6A/cobalt-precorrin-6A reductase
MTTPQIWLIGGTSESAELAAALSEQKLPYIVTVTTEAARNLYPLGAQVQVGKLMGGAIAWEGSAIAPFIQQHHISCILDASHPFACEISRQAIALAQTQAIAYLRYERSTVSETVSEPVAETVSFVQSIEELLTSGILQHQRVLLTLGCRDLYRFSILRHTSQLFARILPSADALAQAHSAGFAPQEIIALRPPVSAALEKALWQQWNISKVVAKSSGSPSGEAIKRQVAQELGIGLILLQRPTMRYPQQTNGVSVAVQFCAQALLTGLTDRLYGQQQD